ncbi:MAG: hypothetical protein AB7O37_10445 [Vicinamibacteria bacterium]
MLSRWKLTPLSFVLALVLAAPASAQEPPGDAAPGEEAPATPKDPERFERRPASSRYVDPDSRFSLQGYVTGTFADFQRDFLRSDFGAPGQLLVPRTSVSSFQYDWAMFLGSRLTDDLRFVVETHFVTRDDGDFHPDIVTTEAKVTWSPFADDHAFRLSLGEYWAPFAGVNDDWFSAVNLFSTVPFAARAFPLHYNERGVELEGEFDLGGARGLNYALSLGNGVAGMTLAEQHGLAQNDRKTLMGRLGFFPLGPSLELGVSAASGRFRGELDESLPADDALRYPATFRALGGDLRLRRPNLEARAYGIRSTEELDGAADLDRWGVMAEAGVRVARELPVLREIWLKARYDRARTEGLDSPSQEDQVVSLGINVRPARRTVLKLEGFFHSEKDGRRLRDDGVVVQLSASF